MPKILCKTTAVPPKKQHYCWSGTDSMLKGNLRKPPFARSSKPWLTITQFFTHWQKFFRDMKLTSIAKQKLYISNLITLKTLVQKLEFIDTTSQHSFHTQRASFYSLMRRIMYKFSINDMI